MRSWLGAAPVDLRKSFDGLAAQVRQHLAEDPLSGHLFVFRNRKGDRVKLLYWDEDGFVILYQRLEEGTFRWPAVATGQARVSLRAAALAVLLAGSDFQKAARAHRYQRPQAAAR